MAEDHQKDRAPQDGDGPQDLADWVRRFLEWLRVRNYSSRAVSNRQKHLG